MVQTGSTVANATLGTGVSWAFGDSKLHIETSSQALAILGNLAYTNVRTR